MPFAGRAVFERKAEYVEKLGSAFVFGSEGDELIDGFRLRGVVFCGAHPVERKSLAIHALMYAASFFSASLLARASTSFSSPVKSLAPALSSGPPAFRITTASAQAEE